MKTKWLAIGIFLLFVSMSIIPMAGSISIEKEQSVVSKSRFYGINISGRMGDNGWYISNVLVSFDFPVNHTYFKINDGSWQEWLSPIIITIDGLHNVSAYYVDNEGNQSPMYYATFKIDKTSPVITEFNLIRVGFFKWAFKANVSDATSGIGRVEFYIDNSLIGSITEPPYDFVWTGFMFIILLKFIRYGDDYLPLIVPYDNAGNTPMNSVTKGEYQ